MRFLQFVIRRHFRPAPDISHYFYWESIRHYRNEKTSGTVTRDRRKNWPIADRHVPGYDPRNSCETHFASNPGPFSFLTDLLFL